MTTANTHSLTSGDPNDVVDWLRKHTAHQAADITIHNIARQEHEFLYIPVAIAGTCDPYDKAVILQELEEAWNQREPRPYWRVRVLPSRT